MLLLPSIIPCIFSEAQSAEEKIQGIIENNERQTRKSARVKYPPTSRGPVKAACGPGPRDVGGYFTRADFRVWSSLFLVTTTLLFVVE